MPQNCCQYDQNDSRGKKSPRDSAVARLKIFIARWADVLGAGQLKFGEFLNLNRSLGLGSRRVAFLLGHGFLRRRLVLGRTRGLPVFVGIDLRLAHAGQIVGDGFFVVHPQVLGVGPDESLVEDAAGQLVEVLFFDGAQHTRADLGDGGNVIEREVLFLALLTEFFSECAHGTPAGRRGFARTKTS